MTTLKDISSGRIMVVSDVHGVWKDYVAIQQAFRDHRERGEADQLVFLGDLVHYREPEGVDCSVEILDDLIEKRVNQPGSPYHAIMGNHEMMHVYHIEMIRSNIKYTQHFEDRIASQRKAYIEFLMAMPLVIRTAGGVMLNHTGASRLIGEGILNKYDLSFESFLQFPHRDLLDDALHRANLEDRHPYSKYDPQLSWHLGYDERFNALWEFLMNKNERAYGPDWYTYLSPYLEFFSQDRADTLTVMINGHINVPQGMQVVAPEQLRLSTSVGAIGDHNKRYVILDAERRYADAEELANFSYPLFEPVLR